jgi:hypothetical protein
MFEAHPGRPLIRYALLKSGGSALDGEELPAGWDPFQVVPASILAATVPYSSKSGGCRDIQKWAAIGVIDAAG